MKKVSTLLLMAVALSLVGVSYDAPAKKIASVELPKIEKSYSANVETTRDEHCIGLISIGVYQDDVFYSETTTVDNYTLPVIEQVYIEPSAPVPILAG